MGDWKKNGNWAPPALMMLFGALVVFALGHASLDANHCPKSEDLTFCAREWVSAASGYFATIVAGVTIYFLWKQIKQADLHRQADARDEARHIAEVLVIDLLATAERVRSVGYIDDLEPPLADLSRQMIRDAVKVSQALAVGLHQHCGEVARFTNDARKDFRLTGNLLIPNLDERRLIVYRATVLSYCFGVAARQIEEIGAAKGPFITASALADLERRYSGRANERGYLDYVFEVTGIG